MADPSEDLFVDVRISSGSRTETWNVHIAKDRLGLWRATEVGMTTLREAIKDFDFNASRAARG